MGIEEKLILIIEDDIGLAELISEQICDLGYDCKNFTLARDAIQWMSNVTPLLILLDYGLPDYTGKEFIEELNLKGITVPPFIVATGRGDERIAVEMMKLGARDYIVKDSQFINLIQVVAQRVIKEVETENKLTKTREELNELNRFNAQIINGAKEGLVVYDNQFNYLIFNKFMENLTGKSATGIIGKNVNEVFPLLKDSGIYNSLTLALQDKDSEIEFFFEIPETGKSAWVTVTFSTLKNAGNEIIGIISIVHDITERKKNELLIQNNHDLLQKLLFRSSDFIGDNTTIDYQSILNTMIEISGAKYGAFNIFESDSNEFVTKAIYLSKNDFDIISKLFDFDISKRRWKDDPARKIRINKQQTTRFEYLRELTGEIIPGKITYLIEKTFGLGAVYIVKVESKKKSVGDFTLFYEKNKELQNQDIVELFANQIALYLQRNQSEKDIKESENKFRLLFEDNPQPMMVHDIQTSKFLEVNHAAIEHYGYSRDEFLNMSIEDIRATGETPDKIQFNNNLIDSDSKEWRHVKKNGQIIDVEIYSRKTNFNGRDSLHLLIQDITTRKIAEKELKEKMDELMRFHNLTIDRELTMIEMKKEINRLLVETGRTEKYNIVG